MKPFRALTLQFRSYRQFFVAAACALVILFVGAFSAYADEEVDALQAKIQERNAQLQALEEEIAQYEAELTKVGADRRTLEAEIARLDLSRKKIAADISVTENRIVTTDLQLDELDEAIFDKERRIQDSKVAIEKSLRQIAQLDEVPLIEHFLAGAAFSDAWEEADQLRQVQLVLSDEIIELEAIRLGLEEDFETVAKKQGELVSYRRQLSGQKSVLDENRRTQSGVLRVTKDKEEEFESLLDEKKAARQQLEAELRDFEAQLEYTLDPSKIPSPGEGIFTFPLDPSFMNRCVDRENIFGNIYCITQYFGNTAFAQSGAYNGRGHNGADFGAPTGTKVVSALSGIVEATGNTDTIRGCYSYGKWVLVRHANGLSTLYAHLSHIGVTKGEAVASGGFLGYSGNTGYSTGPHLHFTTFVSDQVRIIRLGDIKAITNCADAYIPVAPTEAYLNPLSYL